MLMPMMMQIGQMRVDVRQGGVFVPVCVGFGFLAAVMHVRVVFVV